MLSSRSRVPLERSCVFRSRYRYPGGGAKVQKHGTLAVTQSPGSVEKAEAPPAAETVSKWSPLGPSLEE